MSHGCVRSQILAPLACCLLAANASADVVLLRNGGQVRGSLQSADDAPVVVVQTLLGGTISIEQSAILDIEMRPPLVEEYESRARDVAHTVDARWDLAEWCKANGLKEQRMQQSALLLDVDPNHAGAHRVLGHVRRDGYWMTRDEWMTSRGYVLYDGKYFTPREYQRQLYADAVRAAKSEWYPKVRKWLVWLRGKNAEGAAEARANLQALTDPKAVPAIYHFFCEHDDSSVRLMGVELLKQFQGPVPIGPLVRMSIHDKDEDVRAAARAAIPADQHLRALGFYVPELHTGVDWVVERAAVGIGEIGDKAAVPDLIAALITERQYTLRFRDPGYTATRVRKLGGSSHLQDGATYISGNEPDVVSHIRGYSLCHPRENAEVRAALKKITGEDFGYDKREWTDWWKYVSKYGQN